MLTTPVALGELAAGDERPTQPGRDLHWVVQATCPAEWWVYLESCGGGFFHTPAGLTAGAPAGEPVFGCLLHGDEVIGVAAGVRSRCRFGLRPRHVYFPTVPAVVCLQRRDEALAALVEVLRIEGAAEVAVDSFDARWQPEVASGEAGTGARIEYVVRLKRDPDELARLYHKHSRRRLERGMRQGWYVRTLEGHEAQLALASVQEAAASRAAARGNTFQVVVPLAAGASSERGLRWGVTTYSAWDDGMPLATVLVGWANGRAYNLAGGSTSKGYASGAAAWLHWRIMCSLAEQGFTAYNLGGTPASAVLSTDPQHGLYRFKSSFGAELVSCRGVRRALRPTHLGLHRVARWVATRLRP